MKQAVEKPIEPQVLDAVDRVSGAGNHLMPLQHLMQNDSAEELPVLAQTKFPRTPGSFCPLDDCIRQSRRPLTLVRRHRRRPPCHSSLQVCEVSAQRLQRHPLCIDLPCRPETEAAQDGQRRAPALQRMLEQKRGHQRWQGEPPLVDSRAEDDACESQR